MKIRNRELKSEFSMGFKKSLTFIFDVVNLTSTNIGLSSFCERQKIFNCVKQNSFKMFNLWRELGIRIRKILSG